MVRAKLDVDMMFVRVSSAISKNSMSAGDKEVMLQDVQNDYEKTTEYEQKPK